MLLDILQKKNCLLILDYGEHLFKAAAQLVLAWLCNCCELKILASSFETWGVAGKVPYRSPRVSLPKRYQEPSLINAAWDGDGGDSETGHAVDFLQLSNIYHV